MADPIKQALDQIVAVHGRLNDLDTQLSCAIRDVEVSIRTYVSTRIAIQVRLANGVDVTLAFGKHDGKWCLVLEDDVQRAPLLSAPRDVRADMFAGGHIARLISEAGAQVAQQIAEREVAVRAAHGLVAALGAAPAPAKERRRG